MKSSTQLWSVRQMAGLALLGCLAIAVASSSGGAADEPDAKKKPPDAKPAADTSKKSTDVKPAADTSKKSTEVKPAAEDKKAPDAKPAAEAGRDDAGRDIDNRDRRITGYTRPGIPDDKVVNGIIPAAPRDSLGGTVYYKVLELGTGAASDYWWPQGQGEFNDKFRAGERSPPLDKTARYLYLYQTFNDRHSDRSVRRTTVKLLVEPELITSWGYFEGVGFGVDRANGIVPINSTTVTAVANNVYERVFVENSPAYLPGRVLRFAKIESKNKDAHEGLERLVANEPTEGVNPSRVLIVPVSEFEDVGPQRVRRGALPVYGPMPTLFGSGCLPALWTGYRGETVGIGAITEGEGLTRAAGFRAEWRYELERDQWSPVYGFTSNQPPTLEALRLLGLRAAKAGEGVIPVADEGGAVGAGVVPAGGVAPAGGVVGAAAGPEGEVATPVSSGAAAPLPLGASAGSLGGLAPGLGGAGLGGIGGVPLSAGTGTGSLGGGGSGGGTGGGSGTGTPTQAQNQQQPNAQNQVVNVNVQQQQQQKQKQQQQQQQQQSSSGNTNVVPEPSAILLAALGLPFLLLLARRKTAAQAA